MREYIIIIKNGKRGTLRERSASGMEFRVHGFETISGDMRVDLRRGNVRVAEKLLDHTQVRAALQKVGRERMAERMGG